MSISEKHLCREYRSFMSIPLDEHYISWDIICQNKRPELNINGGLSDCPIWEGR